MLGGNDGTTETAVAVKDEGSPELTFTRPKMSWGYQQEDDFYL